ncbi:MAG: DUF308 domain-containing protein [Candidatus Babeliales bacterium]
MRYDLFSVKQIKENAPWYFVLGIGLIVLGILAFFYSFLATIFSVVYLGVMLIAASAFEGFKAFTMNKWKDLFLHLFLGILYFATGFFIIARPILNAVTLTLLLAIFFIVVGISRIIFSIIYEAPHRGLTLFNGIITLILGILIWLQWPYSGLWVIGMFLGIDLIFTGIMWVRLSTMGKMMHIDDQNI